MSKEEKDAIFSVSHYLAQTTNDKLIDYHDGKITKAELIFWLQSTNEYLKYENDIISKYGV